MRKSNYLSTSSLETQEIAQEFAKTLPYSSVVAFFGDLAAGKTTFIKALIAKKTALAEEAIVSPTFVYMNVYDGGIYHFDLYRLTKPDEFLHMGFQEFFDAGSLCVIEWAERIEEILPERTIKVHIEHAGDDCRKISFS